MLPPDLVTLSYTNIERALATNEIQVFEYRLPVPDQGPRDYEARMVPSGPDEVITIVRDVTEPKRMEQALREREALLKATGAMAKVGGWELDAETLEVRWTEQTYHIHGVPTSYKPPLDEAIEFFHPDDRDRLSAAIQRALQAGAPYDLELRFISHQGEHRWVRTQCRPEIAGGTTRKLRGTIQDITERKEAEIALRQTSERLRIQHEIDTAILAAQSPQEIMRVTLERLHHLIPCSHASVAELHATQDLSREVIAFADDQIHSHPPDWHPIADIGLDLMAQIRQGRPYVVQDIAELATLTPLEQALQARGLRAYVSVPLPGQETPIGSLNLGSALPHYFQPDHIEILEEVAASLSVALQQAHLLEQAQQDAETKATLLREVNHRVKNNLSTIVNLLYLEHHHVSPEAMAAYEPIMQDLMHRIVSLARVHDMLSAAEWKPLPLGNLAQQIITGVIQAAPQAIDLTLTTAETPVWVTPDQAHHLALILNELATNTLKYAADGRTTLEIGLEIARTGDRITLTYRNDGPDYPEEVIRMERHSAGLDIIQQVVHRNLNGTVSLRNDGGAVAEVVFPQQDKSQDGVKPYNR
jgi:two-component sensor histidine kinase